MASGDAPGRIGVARPGKPWSPIKSSDRVGLFGATGSGKTYLAVRYLRGFPNVIAADPKGMLKPAEFGASKVYRKLGELTGEYRGGHAIYRPDWAFRRTAGQWDRLAWYLFAVRHVVYYIDEVRALTGDSTRAPDGLSAVVQMGRERGVGCWLASQRPARIPLNLVSECDTYVVFHLGHPRDRALMAELTETQAVRDVIPDDHGFWLYQPGQKAARYYSGLNANAKGAS